MCHCGSTRKSHQNFKMTDAWSSKHTPSSEPVSEQVEHSAGKRSCWSILCGGSHTRSWDILPGTGVRAAQNFAGFASMPGVRSQSKSQHSAREQKQSRPVILIRAGAPALTDTFPHFRVRVSDGITYPKKGGLKNNYFAL